MTRWLQKKNMKMERTGDYDLSRSDIHYNLQLVDLSYERLHRIWAGIVLFNPWECNVNPNRCYWNNRLKPLFGTIEKFQTNSMLIMIPNILVLISDQEIPTNEFFALLLQGDFLKFLVASIRGSMGFNWLWVYSYSWVFVGSGCWNKNPTCFAKIVFANHGTK